MDFRIRGICTSKKECKNVLNMISDIIGNKYEKRWDAIIDYSSRRHPEFLIKPNYHEFNVVYRGDIYKHTDIILKNLDEEVSFRLATVLGLHTVNYSVIESY
jgi:hypothetical protein